MNVEVFGALEETKAGSSLSEVQPGNAVFQVFEAK